jgi:hypothetical protein
MMKNIQWRRINAAKEKKFFFFSNKKKTGEVCSVRQILHHNR